MHKNQVFSPKMSLKSWPRRLALSMAVRTRNEQRFRDLEAAVSSAKRRATRDALAFNIALATSVSADSDVIDIGANTGEVLTRLVELTPAGRQFAFEPIPELHSMLTRDFPSCMVSAIALSDKRGEASFAYYPTEDKRSGISTSPSWAPQSVTSPIMLTVETDTLDNVLGGIARPKLIKIDVEGAELLVLRGARETLSAHRPIVLFEHFPNNSEPAVSVELYEIIRGGGLRIFDFDGYGPYSNTDFLNSWRGRHMNWLAVPE